ncbi:LAMI_0F14378g1_1 [Lachancea mirantina]|uniref:LAMI_0F14378g1_1 n=1 Tax=Lachancea mirantina TaxID=1230905 RepID=A0A1G4K3W1_9SACH|nr:LAMI_0F14378g1_1 [Lachancea mirantina]
MNIIKKIMDSGSKPDLISIPAGRFYLLRPKSSPKATIECIYDDASLVMKESGTHSFQLVVRRDVDDTELAGGDGADEFDEDGLTVLSSNSKQDEEWNFALNEALYFHRTWNKQGEVTFVWRNTKGDKGEKFQFVIDPEIPLSDVDQFLQAAYRCQYETKYNNSAIGAQEKDLKKFDFGGDWDQNALFSDDEHDNSEVSNLENKVQTLFIEDSSTESDEEEDDDRSFEDARDDFKVKKQAVNFTVLLSSNAQLSVFDPMQQAFMVQADKVKLEIKEVGKFEFWLSVEHEFMELGTDVSPDVNPIFEVGSLEFIFNYTFENITLSYKAHFAASEQFTEFQKCWSTCLWESLNRRKWSTMNELEQKYILEAGKHADSELNDFLNLSGESSSDDSSSENDDDDEEEESGQPLRQVDLTNSDDSAGEDAFQKSTAIAGNKSLTIAFKNNRSYVVRGDRIGVFKTDEDESEVNFVTSIKSVADLKGKRFEPANPMLYREDTALILQNSDDRGKLYKMDLERGRIVEEWSAGGKDIVNYGPSKKFDQLTNEQTFLGISEKGLFKVDPRLNAQNKIVEDQSKEYATKYKFCSVGTTGEGFVAVGSEKGEIRLYDKVGLRAKTLIPALGEPINHLCASTDGQWLLASCDSFILLIYLTIKIGKDQGSVAFKKPFSKQEMPSIHILRINPKTASYMITTTKKRIKFSKAFFNTGIDQKEQTIVSSTGPFAITWSIKKILKGDKTPYLIKKYKSNVVEDNFRYGTDKNVLLALKDNVKLSKKSKFRNPSKEIATQRDYQDFLQSSEEVVQKYEA